MTKIDGRRRARPNRSQAPLRYTVSNNASRYEFAIAGHRLALGELAGTHLECDSAKLVTQAAPGSAGMAVEFDISGSSRARRGTFIDANPNLEPPSTRKRLHRWAK
jgi:hypothetical protein